MSDPAIVWQAIPLVPYGAVLHVPVGWETLPPRPENGPEIVRATGGRGRTLIVFKMPVAPGATAAKVAAGAQERLAAHGYEDFSISDAEFAGGPAVALDFVNSGTAAQPRTAAASISSCAAQPRSLSAPEAPTGRTTDPDRGGGPPLRTRQRQQHPRGKGDAADIDVKQDRLCGLLHRSSGGEGTAPDTAGARRRLRQGLGLGPALILVDGAHHLRRDRGLVSATDRNAPRRPAPTVVSLQGDGSWLVSARRALGLLGCRPG